MGVSCSDCVIKSLLSPSWRVARFQCCCSSGDLPQCMFCSENVPDVYISGGGVLWNALIRYLIFLLSSSSFKSLFSVATHLATADNYEDVGHCIENADCRRDTVVFSSILSRLIDFVVATGNV